MVQSNKETRKLKITPCNGICMGMSTMKVAIRTNSGRVTSWECQRCTTVSFLEKRICPTCSEYKIVLEKGGDVRCESCWKTWLKELYGQQGVFFGNEPKSNKYCNFCESVTQQVDLGEASMCSSCKTQCKNKSSN